MFNIDRRTYYLIIIVLLLLNTLMGGRSIENIIYALPVVIVAMKFHEFAHAFVATKLGDDTPRMQGRLNLNPMSHIDPAGLICLALVGFGWGKPVQINPRNFDGKYSISKAEAMVAAAGPIMNFILAFVFMFAFVILELKTTVLTKTVQIIFQIVGSIVIVNIGLGVFNLIPVYPLDGSKVLSHFLPFKAKQWLIENQGFLTIVLIVLIIFTNIMGYITNYVYEGMDWVVTNIVSLFI